MFLSKRWVIVIISVTGLAFLTLLIIQYGWVQTSFEVNRRHFNDKMMLVSNKIRQAFFCDSAMSARYLADPSATIDLFRGDPRTHRFESAIRFKLDSVLTAREMPQSSQIYARTGNICYLMSNIPQEQHYDSLDHATYKMCLCNHENRVAMDIGFNLLSNKLLKEDVSGLIAPSILLIFLLILLFAYILSLMNRQKKLAELKNDFINNLTHEFNTPLFSIGLTTSLLMRSNAIGQSDKLRTYVELINTEKIRLQTQVDKILHLTAVESENLVLEKEAVDLHALIDQNLVRFAEILAERKGSITVQAGAVRHWVKGDRVHLFNAISNLIDNALKYADGVPKILVKTGNAGRQVVLSVRDNGIGMNNSEISMIFNKFYRIKKGDTHDVKGFGLGLSYVKRIVELHQGFVEVSSQPGEGSIFAIHLPEAF